MVEGVSVVVEDSSPNTKNLKIVGTMQIETILEVRIR